MKAYLSVALCAAFICIGAQATAASVSADTLNCRSAPTAKARVVAKLFRGQAVNASSTSGVWSKLRQPSCWVLSRYLVEDATYREYHRANALKMSSPVKFSSPVKKSTSHAPRSMARKKRSSSRSYSSGACPCGGGNVCIGPRGGRYCITSGGNKRYGV